MDSLKSQLSPYNDEINALNSDISVKSATIETMNQHSMHLSDQKRDLVDQCERTQELLDARVLYFIPSSSVRMVR